MYSHAKSPFLSVQGTIAPSIKLLFSSGIIKLGSTSNLYPSPEHPLQAPKGVLNEKFLGSSSSMLSSHFPHDKFSDTTISSSAAEPIIILPLPFFKQVSTES